LIGLEKMTVATDVYRTSRPIDTIPRLLRNTLVATNLFHWRTNFN